MALDEFTSKELIFRVPEISGQVRAPAVLPLSDAPPLCFFAEFLKFIETGGALSDMSENQAGLSIPEAYRQTNK
jgi:hypothetical protein